MEKHKEVTIGCHRLEDKIRNYETNPTPHTKLNWFDRLVCKWFHKKDHVCWDDLWEEEYSGGLEGFLPGNRCWVCNRCTRAWTTPNHRRSLSMVKPLGSWAEYDTEEEMLTVYSKRQDYISLAVTDRDNANKERKKNAKSNHR